MADCSCVVCDDYDPATFYSQVVRKARTGKKCCECERTIEPGEEYEHTSGKWDKQISIFETCADCLSVRASFFCEGYLHGGMWDMLHAHLEAVVRFGDGVSSECIAPLTARAREMVCDAIEKLWTKMDEEE